MCGISGVFYFDQKKVKKDFLKKLNNKQKHRGPDASGIWISKDKKLGLAHTRLSILELSEKANQPFKDESGDFVLTFNGEIYNYIKIREILKKKGYKFKTQNSDTEVLLYSYIEWGISCIQKFRGMFSFAIWDNKKKKYF